MSLTPVAAAALRAELLARAAADQKARNALPLSPPRDQVAALGAIDRSNTARLRQVLTVHGWPGYATVGEDGSNAAWLLIQHAADDLREYALPLLVDAVNRNDASPRDLAYLTDRIRLRRGEPQLYGTQYWLTEEQGLELYQVEDPARLDQRRAAAGLEPHAVYDARMRAAYRS
jgi:hypothetical protein